MHKRLFVLFALFLIISSCAGNNPDSLTPSLNSEWIESDVEAMHWLDGFVASSSLLNEQHWIDNLPYEITGIYIDIKDLGYGAQKYRIQRPGGYAYHIITAIFFNSRPAEYTLTIQSSDTDAFETLEKEWSHISNSNYTINGANIQHRVVFQDILDDFHSIVADDLGGMIDVEVPMELQEDYSNMLSPYSNYSVGVICDFGGTEPSGHLIAKKMISLGKYTMLTNVLRGYNPEARIIAALHLIYAVDYRADDSVISSINKVFRLPIDIEFCSGCNHGEYPSSDIPDLYEHELQKWN